MRFKLLFPLAAVALIGLSAAVVAQQPGQGRGGRGGPPGGFGGGGFGGGGMFLRSRMSFLGISEVKKELELADEQVAEIEKINDELRAKYPSMFGGRGGPGGGGGGPPGGGRRGGTNNNNEGALQVVPAQWYFVALQEPNQQQGQNQPGQNQPGQGRGGRGGGNFQPPTPEQMAEFEKQRLERTREEKAKLAEVLLPNQIKRLNEIFVQVNGVRAIEDDDVAKELGISEAQKAKLAEVRQANGEAMRNQGREAFAGLDEAGRAAKFAEMRKEGEGKLLAVLTADQQKKFEAMKGKPFAMPEGGGRGFGGGGGNRTRGGNNN